MYLFLAGLLCLSGLFQDENSPASSKDIFSALWEMPESHVSVSRMGANGQPVDADAQVVVHEQGKGIGCVDQDNAPDPLFAKVDESVFEEATFKTLIALFDNYTAVEERPETAWADTNHQHWTEVDAFLDAVFASSTMEAAVKHIQEELSPGITIDQIRADTRAMWFEPFTNRYRSPTKHCVGFEHVFIGEDESPSSGSRRCKDAVAGYHSWVKFYIEKKAGKVDCLGYDYPEGNVADALLEPRVTTMLMRWSPDVEVDGGHGHDLLKKPGGFFVGTKPELEIAFGTLAMYSIKAGKFTNVAGKENHHRVRLGENVFDIVMHPQSLSPGKRGDHIRTLYPKFRGASIPESPVKFDLPTQPHNSAPIKIVSTLVNPATADESGEWVKLKNLSEDTEFDLSEWHLCDRNGRRRNLSGQLKPGETVKIELKRVNEKSMMLRNSGGWILLFEGDVRRAAVAYGSGREDKTIEF